jgi:hypothetical protein
MSETEHIRELIAKDCLQDIDGSYYYWPSKVGYLSSYTLRIIADYLDEVNKPWDEKVSRFFEEQRKKEEDYHKANGDCGNRFLRKNRGDGNG